MKYTLAVIAIALTMTLPAVAQGCEDIPKNTCANFAKVSKDISTISSGIDLLVQERDAWFHLSDELSDVIVCQARGGEFHDCINPHLAKIDELNTETKLIAEKRERLLTQSQKGKK